MDSRRTRRTIIAPLGGVALAMALMFSISVAVSAAGPATAWTRQFGTGGSDVPTAVAVDSRDRILVVGGTQGTFPGQTSKGGSDVYLRTFRH